MKNIVIIGCGQLGSRHLQSLLKIEEDINITVIDPTPESITIAKIRAAEINPDVKIDYRSNVTSLDAMQVDLAIIATNSGHRLKSLTDLVDSANVQNIILEKFLFQSESEFENASLILAKSKANVWVNCPRRMISIYEKIKSDIADRISFSYTGSNWGLACNSIHFLDLVAFLTNETLISVGTDELEREARTSKRAGYLEFFGKLNAKFSGGSTAELTCFEETDKKNELLISTEQNTWSINEGAGKVVSKHQEDTFKFLYQSDLTKILATELFRDGTCKLPTYEESQQLHLVLLKALITFNNSISNSSLDYLSIT